jgi:translation initiation factor IF-3
MRRACYQPRVATELADIAKIESAAKMEGKQLTMILSPR